jgi:hypothetical protein
MNRGLGWWAISVYAIAMAFVEAACVIGLKRLYYPEGWAPPFHPIPAEALFLEQLREVATLVMIVAVALLGRPGWKGAWARGLWIFGVWDLCYYLFLALWTGFPRSLLDWDVVFLIPKAWIAPVWVAVLGSVASLVAALILRRAWSRNQPAAGV